MDELVEPIQMKNLHVWRFSSFGAAGSDIIRKVGSGSETKGSEELQRYCKVDG